MDTATRTHTLRRRLAAGVAALTAVVGIGAGFLTQTSGTPSAASDEPATVVVSERPSTAGQTDLTGFWAPGYKGPRGQECDATVEGDSGDDEALTGWRGPADDSDVSGDAVLTGRQGKPSDPGSATGICDDSHTDSDSAADTVLTGRQGAP